MSEQQRVVVMEEWQQRLVAEKVELCERIAKLRQFTITVEFVAMDFENRNLMERQESAMQEYADILGKRIARFK